MKKLESSLLNMTLVLTAVTVIMGGILAAVNDITSKPIAQQKEKALADGIKAVMGIDNLVVAETDTLSQTDSKGKEQLFVIYTITICLINVEKVLNFTLKTTSIPNV